jgi:hypothetical protein
MELSEVIRKSSIFFKLAQIIQPPAIQADQTLLDKGMKDYALNLAIFLVKDTAPLGPLEWIYEYTTQQLQAAQQTGQYESTISRPEAKQEADNLRMAGRKMVQALRVPELDIPKLQPLIDDLQRQFDNFERTRLEWLRTGEFVEEDRIVKQGREAIDALSNLISSSKNLDSTPVQVGNQ